MIGAKLKTLARELGRTNALLYLLDRALQRLSGKRVRLVRYLLVAQPLTPGTTLRLDPRTSIAPVHAGDILCERFPRPAAIIARRYADGAQCLAACIGGEFAGFLWWQTSSYEEDEVRCLYRLAAPTLSVWDFDVYVEPRFRLGRTLARLWQQAAETLHAEGRRWTFSRISAFNAASLASHARLGAQRVGSALFLVLGPWQLSVFSLRPYVHFSASPASRPVLSLALPATPRDVVPASPRTP